MQALIVATVYVALTGPAEQTIWVNPDQVLSLRALRESQAGHLTDEVQCSIEMSDGRFVNVVDTCPQALAKLKPFGGFP